MTLRPLAVICVCCAAVALTLRGASSPSARPAPLSVVALPVRTPVEHRRAEDNTFLTFPEWFLVYSPDEYADFLRDRLPSAFPFLVHVDQFWQGYGAIRDSTRGTYPVNVDYNVMILVIGVSTTIEYGLKWGYETTVGRVAELALGPETTAEDRLAAEVARGYVDFLDIEPWYRFDFVDPLRRVWAETGLWGDHPLRKWERKYFLTSEYAAKAVYGWLIRRSSESAYGVEATTTAVLVDRLPPEAERDLPKAEILERFDDGAVLLLVRRYQAFTGDAHTLTRNGATFIEIAGNRGPILISALVPADYAVDHGNLLMTQPISTRPGRRRILMTVPVSELAKTVAALETPDVELEHIYDY